MGFLKSVSSQALDFLETIILAFVIFILIDNFVVQPHIVKGNSMLPNFHTSERIFTQKITYYFKPPERSDIIVFKYPLAPDREYIKRIIGLPGEELQIETGKVKVFNKEHPEGFLLKEAYLTTGMVTEPKNIIGVTAKFKVPEDNYVVMGDNRPESSDSREWGAVPRKNIIGKVFLRYWPPSKLSLIAHAVY